MGLTKDRVYPVMGNHVEASARRSNFDDGKFQTFSNEWLKPTNYCSFVFFCYDPLSASDWSNFRKPKDIHYLGCSKGEMCLGLGVIGPLGSHPKWWNALGG